MSRKIRIAALLCVALLALSLAGCSSGGTSKNGQIAVKDDEKATELARQMRINHFRYFPQLEGIKQLASPLCVILYEKDGTGFLEDETLSLASPEQANALLLVELERQRGHSGNFEGDYTCDMTYATADGSMSVVIAEDVALEKGRKIADLLGEKFTFAEGEETLFTRMADYQQALESRDYLTAINACRDDYGDERDISAKDVGEPMVYMVDADYVCKPVAGSDLMMHPAEEGQYVPPEGNYVRPEISGSVSLGFTSVGKVPDAQGNTAYTLDEVNARMEALPETFCFSEIVGKRYFGTFTSKSSGTSLNTESYSMRVSVISMDGRLLGYKYLYYDPSEVDTSGLSGQLLGMKLSVDKYNDTIISWSYKSKFRESLTE